MSTEKQFLKLQYPCQVLVYFKQPEQPLEVETLSKKLKEITDHKDIMRFLDGISSVQLSRKVKKFVATCFADIEKYYETNKNVMLEFVDSSLNEYFGIKSE